MSIAGWVIYRARGDSNWNPAPTTRCIPNPGEVRAHYRPMVSWLADTPPKLVAAKRQEADLLFHRVGITFAVYGDDQGAERLIPFDIIPRIIPATEWEQLARGLSQRVAALNRFLHDIYHDAGDPRGGDGARRAGDVQQRLRGDDARRRRCPTTSTPTSRASTSSAHSDGNYYVLEDNLRTPSGVSYMLENRKMMMRLFPELFTRQTVLPGRALSDPAAGRRCAPRPAGRRASPTVVRAHAGPVQQRLLRARLPRPADGRRARRGPRPLRARTTSCTCAPPRGPQRVDVIYRRIDDDFLDPLAFRADSVLGVPGLFSRLPRRAT